MLASVVIACYKHEAYIEECLETIYRQTFPDVELIIVDDHSPDRSFEIAQKIIRQRSFAKRFASCSLLRNPLNLGAPCTWNRALSLAKGEMIFFLNSDDKFSKDRIRIFANQYEREKLFFGFSAVEPIDESGKAVTTHQFPTRLRYAIDRSRITGSPLSWIFLDSQVAASSGNFVLSRDLLRKIGWMSDLKYCHDWEFALRAVTVVEPKYVESDRYMYRLHSTNSFRSLSNVAERETKSCMSSYCVNAIAQRPINRVCLSPINFGDAFYSLIKIHPNFCYWVKQLYAPYHPDHRTVDWNEWTMPLRWR
ncbi:glycosyltransferase family 2 protein [Nitrobacter sp.]|uniref:glycosyltransferase family 2 protein n=1 Tax=unclassified Nitrobacter TaxID=2620411 RepID=UPI00321FAEDF